MICLKNVDSNVCLVILFFLGIKVILFVFLVLGLGVMIMIFLWWFEDFIFLCSLIGLELVGGFCLFELMVKIILEIVDGLVVGVFVMFSNVLKNLFCFLSKCMFFLNVIVGVLFLNLECWRNLLVEKFWWSRKMIINGKIIIGRVYRY